MESSLTPTSLSSEALTAPLITPTSLSSEALVELSQTLEHVLHHASDEFEQWAPLINLNDYYAFSTKKAGEFTMKTLLQYAAENQLTNIIATLKKNNAQSKIPNEKDEDGNTFLHTMCTVPSPNIILLALFIADHPESVNSLNKNAETPLHLAAAARNLEITRALLQSNSIINSKDSKGRTPLYRAMIPIGNNNEELNKLLIEKGGIINSSDPKSVKVSRWQHDSDARTH
jgi:ankyrin repeat protein